MCALRTCGIGLTLLVLAAGASQGARLPAWAEAIADRAPEIPAEPGSDGSRVLLDEVEVRVRDDGTLEATRRRAVQALLHSATDVGFGMIPVDEDTEVLKAHGWHVPPEGRVRKSKTRTSIDVSLDDAFVSDDLTRIVHVPGVEKGSLVFFESVILDHVFQLSYSMYFYASEPTDLSRLVVEVPAGWSIRHQWLHQEGAAPRAEGSRTVWEMTDLAPVRPEPLAPSAVDDAPLLVVAFDPPEGVELAAAVLKDWSSVSAWFERLAGGQDDVTSEIEKLAQTVFADAPSGFFGRVTQAVRYVRDHVRYVDKEVGIGGYRPRAASETARELLGDCKDKGTLLRALLAADGLASYPVLINLSYEDTAADLVPTLSAFNHFVVGVPVPGDEGDEAFRAATVDAGDLGRLLIVDTTDEHTSVGWLSSALGGKPGLVLAERGSRLVPLPADDPSAHRIERKMIAERQEAGGVLLRLEVLRYGEPASSHRQSYAASASEYRQAIEHDVRDVWPDSRVIDFEVEDETADGAFRSVVAVGLEAPPEGGSAGLFSAFPGVMDDLPRVSLRSRERAVRYDHPFRLRFESRLRGWPASAGLQEGDERSGAGWSVALETRKDDGDLLAVFDLQLERTRFEPEAFDELQEFWRAARKFTAPGVAR